MPSRQLQINAKEKRKPQQFQPQYTRDKVPRHFDLIYVSSLRHWIGATKIGLNLMTVCVLISSAFQVSQINLETLTTLKGFFLCTVPFASVGFCVGTALLTRPVLTRIYFDQESCQFIGIRRTFFGSLIQIPYTLRDITLKTSSKSSETWDSLSLNIQNHSVYLLSADFINLQYFNMHVEQRMPLSQSSLAKEYIF